MSGGPRRVLCALMAVTFAVACSAAAKDVPRMTIDELKSLLGKPEVVIIDVRAGKNWDAGTTKIPGAVRQEAAKVDTWMNQYSKDKTIVLYCA